MTTKSLPRGPYPVKLYPWKVIAKMAIDHASNNKYYLYATPRSFFIGYKKKLTKKEQLSLRAHLIYKP